MQVLSEWMGDETICLGLKQQVMSGRGGVQVRSERGGACRSEGGLSPRQARKTHASRVNQREACRPIQTIVG